MKLHLSDAITQVVANLFYLPEKRALRNFNFSYLLCRDLKGWSLKVGKSKKILAQ